MKSLKWMALALALSHCLTTLQPAAAAQDTAPAADALKGAPVASASLSLNECYTLALRQSEVLALKGVSIERSWADYFNASSQALGTVDFVMTNQRQDPQKDSTTIREEQRERKFTVSQPLFQGFKSLGAFFGAGSLKQERVYEKKRAEQLLFLDVAAAFYAVLQLEQDKQILNETKKSLLDRVAELQDREKIGRSRLSEVVTAQARVNINEASLSQTDGELQVKRRVLEFLTGIPLEGRTLTDEMPISESPRALEDYLKTADKRFDVAASQESVRTALQSIVVAQSKLWPVVTLDNNTYEKREGVNAGVDWDLLLKVNVPLFQGGSAVSGIKYAQNDWKKAKIVYQQTKRQAELEIKQAYEKWVSSQKQFRAFEEAVKTSEQNYQLQKQDYALNLVTNLDVLAALESLNNTRQNANQAFYQLKYNYWGMKVAEGSCCESA